VSVHEISFGLSDARLLLEQLRIAARSDGASPKSFALLLRRVFEERAWKQEGFDSFLAYVKADEPYGLGMTEDRLLDAARLADVEPLARSLLYEEKPEAPDRLPGRPPENMRGTHIKGQPQTDTADRIVRRLKRDDPALAADVISGKTTADAAAREKGWRKPRIVLAKRETVADALIKHMPREALQYIADKLSDYLKEN
jgi:hypothetical protein